MSESAVIYNEGNAEKNITAEANEAKISQLAHEINTIKKTTQRLMMEAAIAIGERLVEVKAAVGHGNFGKWLLENVDYSERTAQNLIRLYEAYGRGERSLFGGGGDSQLVSDLTVTQAVALLGIKDADERAEFIEKNDVAAMTKRELEEAIKERNEAQAAAKKKDKLATELSKQLAEEARAAAKNKEQADAQLAALQAEFEELAAKAKAGGGSAEDTARIEALEERLKKAEDTSRWEFAAGVKGIQEGFNALLRLLERQDAEEKARYREALRTLLSKMAELVS